MNGGKEHIIHYLVYPYMPRWLAQNLKIL